MSTADEVRSILRDSGVPLTSGQIIEILPAHCTPQSAYVFLSDAKKRGELDTILEDGKAAYRFAKGARDSSTCDASSLVGTTIKPRPPSLVMRWSSGSSLRRLAASSDDMITWPSPFGQWTG